jgi:hypothetical protein
MLLPDEIPPDYHKRGVAVLIVASIINRGSPSVAGIWKLKVQIATADPFVLEPWTLPPSITLAGSQGGVKILRSAALYDKTAFNPIPTGSRVSGALWFLAEGRELQEMRRFGTKYTLTFEDCNQKTWLVPFVVPAEVQPKYLPGVTSAPSEDRSPANSPDVPVTEPSTQK